MSFDGYEMSTWEELSKVAQFWAFPQSGAVGLVSYSLFSCCVE